VSEHSTEAIWVGLDVHRRGITAAVLQGDRSDYEVVRLSGDVQHVRRFFARLGRRGEPRGCYEASSTGYVLQRALDRDGFRCEVIAPSLIPTRPGDRRKTDRLDALRLARHYRAGLLTPVAVPDAHQEAVRQLVRTRLALQRQVTRLKHQVVLGLSTHGHRFDATKSYWTLAHRAWLAERLREAEGPLRAVLGYQLQTLDYLESQREGLDAEIAALAEQAPWCCAVEALLCFRGIQTLTAMTLLTEIGDVRRFASSTGLMAYVGLIPGERSSGEVRRRGRLTKSGNPHLRRILIESAWQCRHRARATQKLLARRRGKDPELVAIAQKAQQRLARKYWRLHERTGTHKAVAAVARELCGFIWHALWVVAQKEDLVN
jgi:transposase